MFTAAPVCVWLKRDLRVVDHPALATAVTRARGGSVFAVFLYEPEILTQAEWSGNHTAFQRECLLELVAKLARLGIRLITRRGEAVAMLDRLRRETGFSLLVAHEETGTAVSYARDRRVRRWARESGVSFLEVPQTGVVRRLLSRDSWNRRWERHMEAPQAMPLRSMGQGGQRMIQRLASCGIMSCQDLGQPAPKPEQQTGGEAVAARELDDFLFRRGRHYAGGISSPLTAAHACSRLSAHLAFGAVSLRHVWQASENRRVAVAADLAEAGPGRMRRDQRAWLRSLKAMQSRLRWHCHFMQKLEDEPAIEHCNMVRAADGLREEPAAADRLAAWRAGWTGYPLVDACMRSLAATGWLPFRMRALLVSFASYSLWLHWRPTGLFLARQFLDFEPGIHWSQMQMQSGTTGINTLRIYNPTKQALDQDPRGIFIRRWIPELAGVPLAYLHMPWTMPMAVQQAGGCLIGKDYPLPIIDHAAAVRLAKRRLARMRDDPQAQAEARQVARRHGSRRDRRGAMRQDPVRRHLSRNARAASAAKRRPLVDPQRLFPFATLDEAGPEGL
jgi:deoxyribodipyrimidine photo-lyase